MSDEEQNKIPKKEEPTPISTPEDERKKQFETILLRHER